MPSWGDDDHLAHTKRLAAWIKHYVAKGCSEHKAWEVARRNRHYATWPPKQKETEYA